MRILKAFLFISIFSLYAFAQAPAKRESSITSFNAFFEKFKKDPTFQVAHTVFPFKVINVDDEGNTTKFIERKDWKYISFKGKNVVLKQVWSGKTKIVVRFEIKDTGIEVGHYFEYRKGEWLHIYAKNYSD